MYKLEFNFKDREETDLEELNAILSAMTLISLKLEDKDSYRAIMQDGNGKLLRRRLGFDSGVLIGTRPRHGERGYRYQIDTAVVDASVDSDEYTQIWRDLHPDRVIRAIYEGGNDEHRTFVILHHRKDSQGIT